MIEKTDVETLIGRLPELERQMSQPENGSDRRKMQALVREHAALKKITKKADAYYRARQSIDEYADMLRDDGQDDELREMATTELADTQAKLPGLEPALALALVPPDPDDSRNAIVDIRAGTGGDVYSLFAGDLFRMYSSFAEKQRWKIETMSQSSGEHGGFKEIISRIVGRGAYSWLKFESGAHRVQRVPETEAQGRIHTSACTVAIMP